MRWIAIAAGLLTACRGSAPVSQAPPLAPVARAEVVRYGPGTARYRAVSQLKVEQEFNGQVQGSAVRFSYFTTTRVAPDGDRLRATLTVDSLDFTDVPAVSGAELARARGATFTAILSPEGELTDFTGTDSTTEVMQQISSGLREFFPRIPASGAAPGGHWVDTAETRSRFGSADLSIRSINRHDITGWTDHRGQRALHIHTHTSYTVSGTGSQAGQTMNIDGQGERASDRFLSPEGWYLGYTASDSSRFSVLLTDLGMTVPVRQARADTLSVLP